MRTDRREANTSSVLQAVRPRRVVIFRALNLGDMLCAIPALRALRGALPESEITLIGLPWARLLVEQYPHYLDDFIEFPGMPGFPEQTPQIGRFPEFLASVQQRRFQLAVQMQGSGELSNALTMLFGAKHTAGFYRSGNYRPNRETFWLYPEGKSEVGRNLELVSRMGAEPESRRLEFPLFESDRREFEQLQQETGLRPGEYICLHPGARAEARRWPAERFAAVADALSAWGMQVVVTGTAQEAEISDRVIAQMNRPELVVDLTGKTGLGGLAALLKGSRLLVCNDTGVSHLAAALEVPSVVIFSASDPKRWAPENDVLHRALIGGLEVTPQQVLESIQAYLQESSVYAR